MSAKPPYQTIHIRVSRLRDREFCTGVVAVGDAVHLLCRISLLVWWRACVRGGLRCFRVNPRSPMNPDFSCSSKVSDLDELSQVSS